MRNWAEPEHPFLSPPACLPTCCSNSSLFAATEEKEFFFILRQGRVRWPEKRFCAASLDWTLEGRQRQKSIMYYDFSPLSNPSLSKDWTEAIRFQPSPLPIPNENFPLGNLRFLRVFLKFHGAFPPRKCLKSGGNTGSAFVLFLQVPRKSSVFGSNAEDLRKTGSWTRKKGANVPCPTLAQTVKNMNSQDAPANSGSTDLPFPLVFPPF